MVVPDARSGLTYASTAISVGSGDGTPDGTPSTSLLVLDAGGGSGVVPGVGVVVPAAGGVVTMVGGGWFNRYIGRFLFWWGWFTSRSTVCSSYWQRPRS